MSVNNLSKVMTMVSRGVAGGRKKGFDGLLRGYIFSGEQSIIEGHDFITIDGWGDIRFNPTQNFKALVECVGAGAGLASGGYSRGIIEFQRNHDYTIWTGEGGCWCNGHAANSETRATFGGGGLCGRTSDWNRIVSSGGGLSGIFATGEEDITTLHANSLIIAGGAGGERLTPDSGYATPRASGGGITGLYGRTVGNGRGGGGGTQVAGGAAGKNNYFSNGQPGNMLRGGNAVGAVSTTYSGGGGGGGYYGGGGGASNNPAGGGGGGGSGFIHPTLVVDGVSENSRDSEFWLNSPHYNDYSGVGAQRQRLLRAGHGLVTITFL